MTLRVSVTGVWKLTQILAKISLSIVKRWNFTDLYIKIKLKEKLIVGGVLSCQCRSNLWRNDMKGITMRGYKTWTTKIIYVY